MQSTSGFGGACRPLKQAGLLMPGLFEVSRGVPVGLAIEEILLLDECSLEGEWEGQVRFLPLR
ncbi:MAG TPA: hypothetical protein V6D15_10925 [Oculatellaceae cyanobacterium]